MIGYTFSNGTVAAFTSNGWSGWTPDDDEPDGGVREPRRPITPTHTGGAALPEPERVPCRT